MGRELDIPFVPFVLLALVVIVWLISLIVIVDSSEPLPPIRAHGCTDHLTAPISERDPEG